MKKRKAKSEMITLADGKVGGAWVAVQVSKTDMHRIILGDPTTTVSMAIHHTGYNGGGCRIVRWAIGNLQPMASSAETGMFAFNYHAELLAIFNKAMQSMVDMIATSKVRGN